jgi:hypothetical protein
MTEATAAAAREPTTPTLVPAARHAADHAQKEKAISGYFLRH